MTIIVQKQPADSSYDEILRELAFARLIERGFADAQAGRTISGQELSSKTNHVANKLASRS